MPISGVGPQNQPFIPEDKGDASTSSLPEEYKQEVDEYIDLLMSGKTDPDTQARMAELKSKIESAQVPDDVKELVEKMESLASNIGGLTQQFAEIEKQLQDPTISPKERTELEKQRDWILGMFQVSQTQLNMVKNQFDSL